MRRAEDTDVSSHAVAAAGECGTLTTVWCDGEGTRETPPLFPGWETRSPLFHLNPCKKEARSFYPFNH